jgi:hypothetical protein
LKLYICWTAASMVASPAAPKALKDKTTINTQKRNIAVLSYPDRRRSATMPARMGGRPMRAQGAIFRVKLMRYWDC